MTTATRKRSRNRIDPKLADAPVSPAAERVPDAAAAAPAVEPGRDTVARDEGVPSPAGGGAGRMVTSGKGEQAVERPDRARDEAGSAAGESEPPERSGL